MPEDLQALLGQARGAGPLDRIEFRDRIASFGEDAIPTITPWLHDAALAGFAVRVLERIAREPGCRDGVVKVLLRARTSAPEPLHDDIDRILISLGRRVARRRPTAG